MSDYKNVAPMAHNYGQNRRYRWLHWLVCGNARFFWYRREHYRKGMAGNERALRFRDSRSCIFLNFRHSVVLFVAKFASYAREYRTKNNGMAGCLRFNKAKTVRAIMSFCI